MAGSIEISSQEVSALHRVETAPGVDQQRKVESLRVSQESEPQNTASSQDPTLDKQAVTYLADALNKVSQAVNRNLQFSVDEDTGRIIIKVTDGDTGEVIREIPPKEIMQSSQTSLSTLVGLLYNGSS